MAAEPTAASITAPDPIHTPCPHCGVIPATTPDPMGSLIACLRAVVADYAPHVKAINGAAFDEDEVTAYTAATMLIDATPAPRGWDRIEAGPTP